MANRFNDFNLDGEERVNILGEVNSKQAISVPLPASEHRALKWHLAQIDKARLALAEQQVDETDEDFFDFGEDEFSDNQSEFEALFERFNAWKFNRQAESTNVEEKPAVEPTVTPEGVPAGEQQE